MKKFSKISDFKVNSEESKNEVINDNHANIKYSINRLIDDFLRITFYSKPEDYLTSSTLIEGREEFIDALVEFMKQDEIKEQIKLLENVKFNGLDNTLLHLTERINESQTPGERAKHNKRVRDLAEKCGSDVSKAKEETERQANRIENGEKAYYRSLAAENLIGEEGLNKNVLKEISKIFLFRSQQLGYRK